MNERRKEREANATHQRGGEKDQHRNEVGAKHHCVHGDLQLCEQLLLQVRDEGVAHDCDDKDANPRHHCALRSIVA